MLLYKLTDENHQTGLFDGAIKTQWGVGVTHTIGAEYPYNDLCGLGVYHGYLSPELAAFLNPIHADFASQILWETEGSIVANDGLKIGSKAQTTLRIIPLPQITIEQRVKIAYRLADVAGYFAAAAAAADAAVTADAAVAAVANRHAADAARYAANTAKYAVKAARCAADGWQLSFACGLTMLIKEVMEES